MLKDPRFLHYLGFQSIGGKGQNIIDCRMWLNDEGT